MSHDILTTRNAKVLVVDDHPRARASAVDSLRHCGHSAEACSSGAEALAHLATEQFDVVVTDLQMPGMNGIELIREIERRRMPVQVLMVTAHASVGTAVEAMRLGAFDYLEKPYDIDRLEESIDRAIQRGALQPETNHEQPRAEAGMIGESSAMQALRDRIARVAASDETVLICGESGVGKELVARALHTQSPRAAGPLVSLNCPALSEQLTESELFGHRRGAFTGADDDRIGRFEIADGGSLLLDEVTEVNLALQAKLLRVLQERTFERVGSSETQQIDVRVLATTNRDLHQEIAEGRFREDLYYRLAVVPLNVPPLRQREGDVLLLADHFLQAAAEKQQREPLILDQSARVLLKKHAWPGNVRELHNVITRACVLAEGHTITAELIQPWLRLDTPTNETPTIQPSDSMPVGMSLAEIERRMILTTLEKFDGHRAKTAEALGIGVRTLSSKLRSYGVAPRQKDFSGAV